MIFTKVSNTQEGIYLKFRHRCLRFEYYNWILIYEVTRDIRHRFTSFLFQKHCVSSNLKTTTVEGLWQRYQVDSVHTDFLKVFDRLNHNLLLVKLTFSEKALQWIYSLKKINLLGFINIFPIESMDIQVWTKTSYSVYKPSWWSVKTL